MLRVRILSLVAVTLAASSVVSGCGGDDRPGAASAPAAKTRSTPAATTATTASPTAAPSPTATSTASATAAPTGTPGGRDGRHKVGLLQPRMRGAAAPTDHLLDAERLPEIGGRAWSAGTTAPEDPAGDPAVGACQKTPLGTIGAVEAVRRTFSAPAGQSATEVVARFADPRSAWRAHRVLVAWRDDCESRRADATVGDLRPVTVRTGIADSYRASYGRTPRASGIGILRTGSYLTLVEVTAAPDSYPTTWDPARVVVRRVARTF